MKFQSFKIFKNLHFPHNIEKCGLVATFKRKEVSDWCHDQDYSRHDALIQKER